MNAPMFGRSSPLSRPAILFLTLPLSFAVPVAAQSYTVLHAFDGTDGSASVATLVQGSDGNLYGTTSSGGTFGLGTVFAATPAGVLTSLYSFAGSDGRFPIAGLATWSRKLELDSARRLRDLVPARLAPGHGPVLEAPAPAIQHAITAAANRA